MVCFGAGGVLGDEGRFDAFETVMEILRVKVNLPARSELFSSQHLIALLVVATAFLNFWFAS